MLGAQDLPNRFDYNMFGPTGKNVKALAQSIASWTKDGDFNRADLNRHRRLAPYQNAWPIRGIIDKLEEAFADYMELPYVN